MHKPTFFIESVNPRSCYVCRTEDRAYMFNITKILGNEVCWSCEERLIKHCFTSAWADRNPFIISILMGFILCGRYGGMRFNCDTAPSLTLKVPNIEEHNGVEMNENNGIIKLQIRFPLTGLFTYSNIIEHYPDVLKIFEGHQNE